MFYRPCNLEGVGGYKKQTELLPIIADNGTLFFMRVEIKCGVKEKQFVS